ncbi:MAG TPA: ATP-binding protein [Burkholderiaceae bacterium]|nr:ATP-binding protein [Burkholderiaceae bacterium]
MRQLADTFLPVNSDLVANALHWLESVGEQQSWPARTRFKLQLCLDETLTNVAMHGYTGQPASDIPQVNLRLYQDGDSRLQLEILDNGSPFDPTARASRDLDESLEEAKTGGHGLRLLRHYLEDMRYERRDGWNKLTLIAVRDDA